MINIIGLIMFGILFVFLYVQTKFNKEVKECIDVIVEKLKKIERK